MANHANNCLMLKLSNLDKSPHYTYRWCSGETMWHRHTDFYEIILVTSGSFKHQYKNNTEIINQGELLIFDINQAHRLSSFSSASTHFTLCLSANYFDMLMNVFSFYTPIFEKHKYHHISLEQTAFSYLLMLTNRMQSNTSEFDKIKLFFYNALSLILSTDGEYQKEELDFATDICINIKNLSYLSLPMGDIYKKYPYSVPTIIKKFKELTGMTPAQFQTNARLEHAARQLRESSLPTEEIFFNLGFNAPSHFYKLFKTYYNMTPNAYRKKYQGSILADYE